MLTRIERTVLCALRRNARFTFAGLSRHSGFAQSSLFEKLKAVQQRCVTRQHTLLAWEKAGFSIRLFIAIKAKAAERQRAADVLCAHPSVNNVLRVNAGFDFFADLIFSSLKEAEFFLDSMQKLSTRMQQYFVIDALREEFFLTEEQHLSEKSS